MIHGRGTAENPPNRFERIACEPDPDAPPDENVSPRTELLRDHSKSLITKNDSPDVGFDASINPYRGCEHGCIYCYARPYHEYLGFSAGLDFETKILVKEDAPELLRKELSSPKWKPQVLAISGVTDPYQPVERRLQLTRRCLEVLAEFRNPVAIITKNHLVTRDIDVLSKLAEHKCVNVTLSVTTLDPDLAHVMEPRTSVPARRLAAIGTLVKANIPVSVNIAPVIPGLTDHEVLGILEACSKAGARRAGYIMVRLPFAVKELFDKWLQEHRPLAREKVLNRIREVRGGKLNDPRFGSRMSGEGEYARHVEEMFRVGCLKFGFNREFAELSTSAFRRPPGPQLELFG